MGAFVHRHVLIMGWNSRKQMLQQMPAAASGPLLLVTSRVFGDQDDVCRGKGSLSRAVGCESTLTNFVCILKIGSPHSVYTAECIHAYGRANLI